MHVQSIADWHYSEVNSIVFISFSFIQGKNYIFFQTNLCNAIELHTHLICCTFEAEAQNEKEKTIHVVGVHNARVRINTRTHTQSLVALSNRKFLERIRRAAREP